MEEAYVVPIYKEKNVEEPLTLLFLVVELSLTTTAAKIREF